MQRAARANVDPVRQRTQYSCMSTSMMMCLRALGYDTNEDEVNKVMGAAPMKGAAWENALACANHYGCISTLRVPSTVPQLKEWTDAEIPVMIAWNPEGRDWSHASVVFDVDDDLNVYVADPNMPDPEETIRVVPKGEFYGKWYEKWPNYLVRRPACAIQREVTPDGRQVLAANPSLVHSSQWWRVPLEDWEKHLSKSIAPKRGIRSHKMVDIIEQYAYALGLDMEALPEWMVWLGRRWKVDVKRVHRSAGAELSRQRVASAFLASQQVAARFMLNGCGGSCDGCSGNCDGNCGGGCGCASTINPSIGLG